MLFIQAKDDVKISNELNTTMHFTYEYDKQYKTVSEDGELILGDRVPYAEDIYKGSFAMISNKKNDEKNQDRVTIPTDFVVTEIEGTITAE